MVAIRVHVSFSAVCVHLCCVFLINLTEDEESSAHLREAMKDGYVVVSLVKVIVEGPAGVGKTCLLNLLLKKPPPQDRHSTGCAEQAIRLIRVGKERGSGTRSPLKSSRK